MFLISMNIVILSTKQIDSSTTHSSEQLQLLRPSYLSPIRVCIGSHAANSNVGPKENDAKYLALDLDLGPEAKIWHFDLRPGT